MITINVTIDSPEGEKNLVYRLTRQDPDYAVMVRDGNGFGGLFPDNHKALMAIATTIEAVLSKLPVC